jgi:hypothetical protein
MKLNYIRNSFDTFSAKAGELTRQMALAGIAVSWIFKTDYKTYYSLPPELYLPLYLFCACLLTDLIQYIYGTIAWGIVLRKSKNKQDEDDVFVSKVINTPTWVFFVLKIGILVVAYIFLLTAIINRI